MRLHALNQSLTLRCGYNGQDVVGSSTAKNYGIKGEGTIPPPSPIIPADLVGDPNQGLVKLYCSGQ